MIDWEMIGVVISIISLLLFVIVEWDTLKKRFAGSRARPPVSSAHATPIDWSFWVQWTLLTAVGWMVGSVVGGEVGEAIGEALSPGEMFAGLFTAIAGSVMVATPVAGIAQSLMLHGRIRKANLWLLVSAMEAVTGIVLVVPSWDISMPLFIALRVTITVLQWQILQFETPKAGWWLLAAAVAWIIPWIGIQIVTGSYNVSDILQVGIGGIMYGAISGLGIVWLLR